MKRLKILACLFFSGYWLAASAQNPYIRHYTTDDGLPSNTIYQIHQDRNKFLWFTSEAGVVKYDGSNFTCYRMKDGLSSNDVVRMSEDSKGRIWFFCYNSLVNFMYNEKIYNIKNAPFLKKFIGKGFILDLIPGPNQSIYFYNWQREVFCLDKNDSISKIVLFDTTRTSLPQDIIDLSRPRVHHLRINSEKDWIVWTSRGILSLDSKNGMVSFIDSTLHCTGVFPVRNNAIYVVTYNNLVKISGNFNKKEVFPFHGDVRKIKTIIEDNDGHIWIAALDEGVFCFDNNRLLKHLNIKDALGLLQDHENNIWISTRSDGIYTINHDILSQKHLDPGYFDGQGLNRLFWFPKMGLFATNNRSIYLINHDHSLKLPVPSALQPVNLLFLFQDNTLLMSSLSYKSCAFRGIHFKPESNIIAFTDSTVYNRALKRIFSDKTGNLMTFFEQEHLLIGPAKESSLILPMRNTYERINNAFYNNNNELIINSKKNYLFRNNKLEYYPALSRFDGNIISEHLSLNDTVELFNIDGDSLYLQSSNKIYNLTSAFNVPITWAIKRMAFHDSTLYLATLRDIYVCHNPISSILGEPVYLEPLSINFNDINDILVKDDSLYIASDDGLTIIAEKAIAKSISYSPIPYLKSIMVNDEKVSLSDNGLSLRGKNSIRLFIGCIRYFTSSVIYSYMLQGSDNNWITGTGSDISVVYQNLPKGKYVFRLRVRKSNSDWSKPLVLPITIKPTLLESPLSWVIMFLVFSGLIFLISYRIRSQKIKKAEVDHQLVLMEQKALQSMMNPHFIFNSLGSIQNYLLKNKGNEAVIYLSNFARLIRQNLNAVNSPMVELSEETDRLRNYLDLEQKRLENNFEYAIETDPVLDEDQIYMPSMIVQPFVENSIWHGLATLDDGLIRIAFHLHDAGSLKIIIEDNGIGIIKSTEYSGKTSHKKHLGMQIIQKRLDLLGKKYHVNTSMRVEECFRQQSRPGTRIELIVPFLYKTDESEIKTAGQ